MWFDRLQWFLSTSKLAKDPLNLPRAATEDPNTLDSFAALVVLHACVPVERFEGGSFRSGRCRLLPVTSHVVVPTIAGEVASSICVSSAVEEQSSGSWFDSIIFALWTRATLLSPILCLRLASAGPAHNTFLSDSSLSHFLRSVHYVTRPKPDAVPGCDCYLVQCSFLPSWLR